jgi:hypothetical protein
MDIRVEAGPLTAAAVIVESKQSVENIIDIVISSPVVSRFSLIPVISVGGTSISSITPETNLLGVRAAA